MFRQLRNYYIVVSLPFILLLSGSAIFYEAIESTIIRNPHPQINFAIFVIILVGGILIVLNAHRLVREAKTIVEFSGAIRAKADSAILQTMANGYTGDISSLLLMVASSAGRSISHQEQTAIQHELTNSRARLLRRNALPQYLTGLLVGMGLLGTFIGLLSTLSDITILISSFAELDMGTASPLLVFRTMIERMKAPMQSMSIAFSASMFGLLGSIVLGLMMVGIRRLQGDISSLLGSEVARHIETALAHESVTSANRAGAATVSAIVSCGDESKTLSRIEERLAEAVRVQHRMLASEIEDFQNQRADMLRTLSEQNESSNSFRVELQQLGRQFGAVLDIMERGNSELCSRISELAVHIAADAKESHKLLGMQVDEQKRTSATLASYKIEERLVEAARVQQRALSAEIADFQNQRADMLQTLSEQTEASINSRLELQQLGRQLGTVFKSMERGNSEIYNQITELMIHMAADAMESQKLLAMQVNEQKGLREVLEHRTIN